MAAPHGRWHPCCRHGARHHGATAGPRAGSVGNGNRAEARPWFRSTDGPQLGRPGVPAGAWPCKLSAVTSDGGHFRQLPEASPSPRAATLLLKPPHHHRLHFPFLLLLSPCEALLQGEQQAFPSPPPSPTLLPVAGPPACERGWQVRGLQPVESTRRFGSGSEFWLRLDLAPKNL